MNAHSSNGRESNEDATLQNGASPPNSSNGENVFKGKVAALQKVLSAMPADSHKEAYSKALERCPDLVETESNPLFFLRNSNGNILAAARKLLCYWERRVAIFGEERAFLPMVATGDGALGPEDVALLHKDYIVPLQPDQDGCMVLMSENEIDEGADGLEQSSISEETSRFYFYWLQVCSEQVESQTKGFVFLKIITSLGDISTSVLKLWLELLNDAFPAKIKAAHFCLAASSPRDQALFQEEVIPSIKSTIQTADLGDHLLFHFGARQDILHSLESSGMLKEHLPPIVGGTWLLDLDRLVSQPSSLPLLDLPEEEVHEIEDDDRKPSAVCRQTANDNRYVPLTGECRKQALQELEAALREIADEDKQLLMEARERAPHLFEAECDPLRFLYCESYDAMAAAHRLINYWKHRHDCFGDQKYLPMNQTGSGALSPEDLELLKTGFVAPIYDDGNDGVPVLLFNLSRLEDSMYSTESKLRCIFYIVSTAAELNETLTGGWLSVGLLSRDVQLDISLEMSLLTETFPIRIQSVHMMCIYPQSPQGSSSAFQEAFTPIFMESVNPKLRDITLVHIASSEEELFAMLSEHGMSRAFLPVDVGGEWTYDKFDSWRKERLHLEQKKMLNEKAVESLDALGALAARELNESGVKQAVAERSELDVNLVEVAMERLQLRQKAAYLEAKHRCPELVLKESNPALFLINENHDADAAARRLADYWYKRKQLFGEKAFLPLNQTGEGCLSRGDMALLSTGFMVLLPDCDTGHIVLCYDGSRLCKSAKDCQLRVAFYWFQLATENEKSQEEGVILLHLVDKLNPTSRDKRQSLEEVMSVFPIRIKVIHAVANTFVRASDKGIITAAERLFGSEATNRVVPYSNVNREVLINRLESEGLSRVGLPKTIGGSWGYESFIKWQELRTRWEWELPPGAGNKDAPEYFDFSSIKNLNELDEDDKVERKRRMNVLHSRRKRERERIEIEVLQEQCNEFEEKNNALFQDNVRLENVLSNARKKVARFDARARSDPNAASVRAEARRSRAAASLPEPRPLSDAAGMSIKRRAARDSRRRQQAAFELHTPLLDALLSQQSGAQQTAPPGSYFDAQQLALQEHSHPSQFYHELEQQEREQEKQQELLQAGHEYALRELRRRHAQEEKHLQDQLRLQQSAIYNPHVASLAQPSGLELLGIGQPQLAALLQSQLAPPQPQLGSTLSSLYDLEDSIRRRGDLEGSIRRSDLEDSIRRRGDLEDSIRRGDGSIRRSDLEGPIRRSDLEDSIRRRGDLEGHMRRGDLEGHIRRGDLEGHIRRGDLEGHIRRSRHNP